MTSIVPPGGYPSKPNVVVNVKGVAITREELDEIVAKAIGRLRGDGA